MNRRSFLRRLLGATALVPLAKFAPAATHYLPEMEWSGFESRIPVRMLTMSPTDWHEVWKHLMTTGTGIQRISLADAP